MAKTRAIEVPIVGRDETRKATESAKRNIGRLTQTIKSYYGEILAITGGIYGLIRATSSLVDAYKQQQVAESKLITTFISTGRYTAEAITKAKNLASEWQSLAGVSDDMVINAQAILATFTKISTDTFPEAIEAALNMSKTFGQDLQQSIIQLGTALNDPIMGVGRLRRIGISFSEEQKELIKQFMEQNDLMSAQRVILDELETELGGVARAYGQTVAGEIDKVREQFDELKESLGEMLVEGGVLPAFLEMATAIVDKLSQWAQKLGLITGESNKYMEMNKQQLESLIRLNDERLDQVAKEILEQEKIIESTKGLIRVHPRAKRLLQELNEEWTRLVQEQYKARQALELITNRERKATQQRQKLNQVVKEGIETLSEEQIAQINSAKQWQVTLDKITAMNAAETLWARDKTAKQKSDELKESLYEQATAYKYLSLAIDQYYKQNKQDLVWSQKEVVTESNKVVDAYSVYLDQINRINRTNIDYKNTTDMVLEEHEKMKEETRMVADAMSSYWGDFWTAIGESTWKGVESIREALKQMISSLMQAMGKLMMLRALEALATGNYAEAAMLAFGSAGMFVGSGMVKGMAEGGIVTKPTLALIGEREPEAVVPLKKFGGITVNVYGSVMTEKDLTQTIIREAKRQGFV